MSYFSAHYHRINYPVATVALPGLRNAQLGAIYSIGSHFTINQTEPALIVMPTGSGKTAVLNLSSYLLRASRVLVISSSRMVRGQIAEEFETLKTLKRLSVFHADLEPPKVKELKSPIKSADEWLALEEFDVVVGIPNSINVGINSEFRPSQNLFDLILVDEAHHVPAFTWTNVIEAFGDAKKVYFTATPFRRDKKEIKGKLAYVYPISKAYEDKIFGDVGYYPVITNGVNIDLAIAVEAERVFNEDKAAGLKHFMMVRTETKDHAAQLMKLYQDRTELKLKKIDSNLSYRTIKRTIQSLKNGGLDGIICVDMLGEGFDFPNLKIAAIHSPKKSLANTLQFIGRFARINAENIGEAKFLAIPTDIEIGKKKLYEEGAIWNDIIKNLSEEVLEEEDEIKTVLDTFEERERNPLEKQNISSYNLNPYCHIKAYRSGGVNLDGLIEISGHQIIHHWISTEHNAVVFITRETEKPKWILTDDLINVKHYFFLIYYDVDTGLLFIHSSIKTVSFYDQLIETFAVGDYERISKHQTNKVLMGISNPEFFNIGMQNRSANSGESYRIVAGSNAENTIRKSHSKNYSNGHVFMKGEANGANVTIGYSSGSKIWSNAYEKIPDFIKWCKVLAAKIVSKSDVKTNTGFDNLPIGEVVSDFKLPAHCAMWHHSTFSDTPFLNKMFDDEVVLGAQLLDFSIELKKELSILNTLFIDLIFDETTINLSYDFENHFQFCSTEGFDYWVETNGQMVDLLAYLNESPFQIYLDDFATVSDHEFFAPPREGNYVYSAENILSRDWARHNTDITREFYNDAQDKIENGNKNSIHDALHTMLIGENHKVLIYDHGTGEVADFITVNEFPEKIQICLYHVKGSGGDSPGDRVGDVYEVCMQVVKSQAWATNKHTFIEKIVNRTRRRDEKFFTGDRSTFDLLMQKNKRTEFNFSIVQPGLSKGTFSSKLSYILGATDDSLRNNGFEPLVVYGS